MFRMNSCRSLALTVAVGVAAVVLAFASVSQGQSARPPLPSQMQMTPGRSGRVPTPSALPSQRLASQVSAAQALRRTSCLIQSSRKVGSNDLVEVLMEVSGKIDAGLDGKSKPEEFEAVAGFRYEEHTEDYRLGSTIQLRSIRQYEQAGLKRRIGRATSKPLLDAARKNIVCMYDGKTMTRFSPAGPLKNDQFALLDELMCDSLLLDGFLPNREVKTGEEWTAPDDIVRQFLGLAAMENNTIRMVLTAIIDDIAEVDIVLNGGSDDKGNPLPSTIQGTSLGAPVEIDLQGKYQFDLRSGRMTWFGVRINERRGAGLIEPKLDTSGLVRLKIAPLTKPEHLTDDVLETLRVAPSPELLLLSYNGLNGPWRFRHERQWKMIEDGQRAAALCLMLKGEGIAQCNILLNKKVERNTMPSLEVYKDELKRGLGEKFGKIVKEDEFVNPDKYMVYTVMIDGRVEELPFRWIYYLLTDPAGNQVTLMFEIRADMLEKFGPYGREILQSFRIIPPPDSQEPEAGKAQSAPAKTENAGIDSKK